MKGNSVIVLLAVCVLLAAAASPALAEDYRADLNLLLPKDFALVVRVDVAGLREADVFRHVENSIFERMDFYKEFMRFLKGAELDPIKKGKGGVAEGHVGEVILVKRNLDASTDDTSALVVGKVTLDYASRKLSRKIGAERVKEIEYQDRKIYEFSDLFREGEAVYMVQLKGAIAVTLSEKEAGEYVDREAGKLDGLAKNEDLSEKIADLRPSEGLFESTIWGLAFFSEKRRKEFAGSKDPEEMMLQYLQCVTLKMDLGKGSPLGFAGGADINIECACTTEESAGFMKIALKVLCKKLVLAFENIEAKNTLQKAAIFINLGLKKNVTVKINSDDEACKSLLESLGWMIFGSREVKETAPGDAVPDGDGEEASSEE